MYMFSFFSAKCFAYCLLAIISFVAAALGHTVSDTVNAAAAAGASIVLSLLYAYPSRDYCVFNFVIDKFPS